MEKRDKADTKSDDKDRKPAAKSKTEDESSPDSKQSAKRKRKSPAVPWKKPKDMPKRPLSAYNIFFKEERSRLISAGPETEEAAPDEVAKKRKKTVRISDAGKDSARKKHVRGTGIGFAQLAKTIAAKWKNLDASSRAPYEERAAVEKERYDKAVAIWREEQKKKQAAAKPPADEETKKRKQRLHASAKKEATEPPSPLTPDRSLGSFMDYPADWFETNSQRSIPTAEGRPHEFAERSPQPSRLETGPDQQQSRLQSTQSAQQSRFETEARVQRSIFEVEPQQILSHDAATSAGSSGGTFGSSELARSLFPPAIQMSQHFPFLPVPQAPVPQAAHSLHNIFWDPVGISNSRTNNSMFMQADLFAHGAGMGGGRQLQNVPLPSRPTLQPRASSQFSSAIPPLQMQQSPLLIQSQAENLRRQARESYTHAEVGYVRPVEGMVPAIQSRPQLPYQQQQQFPHLQPPQQLPQQAPQQPHVPPPQLPVVPPPPQQQQQQRSPASEAQEEKESAADETSAEGPSFHTLRQNLDEDTIDFLTNLQFK